MHLNNSISSTFPLYGCHKSGGLWQFQLFDKENISNKGSYTWKLLKERRLGI